MQHRFYTDADGETVVSAVDPEALFTVVGRDASEAGAKRYLAPLAREVGVRLSRALERLPI